MKHARVALLTTYYHPVLGGAETAARQLAAFLKQRGHEIFVITKRTDPALPIVDTIDDVPIQRIPYARCQIGAFASIGSVTTIRSPGGTGGKHSPSLCSSEPDSRSSNVCPMSGWIDSIGGSGSAGGGSGGAAGSIARPWRS